jgi:coronin-1B/1C/6
MSRIVRSSKFRHVFGTQFKKEECYDELKVTRTAWDSNYVCANPKYIAVLWEAAGGGSFAVFPHSMTGKLDPKLPLITGHKSAVQDIDFHPFNDNLIASVSEDGTGKIWGIPEGGLKENLNEPLQNLSGHKRKVGTCSFNPVANNLLATSSGDYSVKVWDIEKGAAVLSVDAQHADIIQSCGWNSNGSMLASTCKDKKVRLIDARQQKATAEAEAHLGVKGSRVTWLGQRVFTVGFNKTSEREFALWDPRAFSTPLVRTNLDSSSGVIMPFYDADNNMLYLAGKGDGNIRYYEVVDEAPYFYFLSEFKSATAQRGMAMLPKRSVNVSDCEIARALKLTIKTLDPVSFQVPRKSEIFQDDLYPDSTRGRQASARLSGWEDRTQSPRPAALPQGLCRRRRSNPTSTPTSKRAPSSSQRRS